MSNFQLNLIATIIAVGLIAFGSWLNRVSGVFNVIIGVGCIAVGLLILIYLYGKYLPPY